MLPGKSFYFCTVRIKMKRYLGIFLIWLFYSCAKETDYSPDSHLTPQEKDAIITKIVRYVSSKPENVSDLQKFESRYDSFYLQKASAIRFEQYYPANDYSYFLISQPASSLVEKRHATGGRLKLSDSGEVIDYEEIFRTWKMVPDTLKSRSYLLFDKMVKREPLDSYYTKNSNGIDYIEFPDDRTYYDKNARTWKVK